MANHFMQNLIGLDIGEQSWRLVQLKKNQSKISLVSFNEIKTTSGLMQGGLISKTEEAVKLLKELIQTAHGHKIYTKYLSVCLPEPKTFIKVVNLVYLKSKNIEEEVVAEAKKHIPYPLEKTYLDWQYVSPGDKAKVIIAVCPKEIVDNYQKIIAQAGLLPLALEVEAMSLARCLFPLHQNIEEPVMVVDLGASRTGLFVYEKNYIPFSLSLNLSAEDLTKWIKDKLNLTLSQAEKAKKTIGLSATQAQGGLKEILKEPLGRLAEQIREAKYFYYEHFGSSQTIAKIYLTGGGAALKGLPEFLEEKTDLPVGLANPLTNLSDKPIDLTVGDLQTYGTAIGLALRQYQ